MRVSQRVKGGRSVMQFKCRIWWIFRLLRSGCGASKCLIYLSPSVSSLLHCFSWVQKYELSYFFRVGGEIERGRERRRERGGGGQARQRTERRQRERERQWQYLWPTWVLLSLARWNAWRQQHIAPFRKTFRHTQTLTRAIMHMCTFPNMPGRMHIIFLSWTRRAGRAHTQAGMRGIRQSPSKMTAVSCRRNGTLEVINWPKVMVSNLTLLAQWDKGTDY